MKNKKAAIIIVNWNGKRFLKNCLNAVFNQTYKNFDVYFVDNGSIDGSLDYIKEKFPKVKVVQLDKNYGFAKGNNEGIKEAFKNKKIKYIVCLNNDTIVDKNWLKELVRTAEKGKKIGLVGSKSILPSGKIHNIGLILNEEMGLNKNRGVALGYNEKKNTYNYEQEIFAVCGVSLLIKRKVLEVIGLFDEDFFAYAEDFDLGFRARLKGWKGVYNPKSKLLHLHSQTSKEASVFKAYFVRRNAYFTIIKNFPKAYMLMYPLKEIYSNVSSIFTSNNIISVKKIKKNVSFIKLFILMIRIYSSVIYFLPKMLVKRWKIQSSRKVSNKEIKSWFRKFGGDNIKK